MYQFIKGGTGIVLALLVMLGLSLPPAVAAEVHYNGGFEISHKNVPLRGSYYVPPYIPRPAHPILFPYYFPVTAPVAPGAYQSFYYTPEADPTGPYGVPLADLPWNRPGHQGYDEPPAPSLTGQLVLPQKYRLRAEVVTQDVPNAPRNVAVMVARLPAGAPFWVEDQLTTSTGPRRYFVSPPLTPGKKYTYTVRAAWYENGRWVGRSLDVPVQTRQLTAIYLERAQ